MPCMQDAARLVDGAMDGADRPARGWRRRFVGALLASAAMAATAAPAADPLPVQALQQGAVLLMRHAQTTPGVGDPPGWRLADCASQRNLSAEGMAQAHAIGDWFRARGLKPHAVRHSPWCRTRDTALLAFGEGDPWPALANIFEDRRDAAAQAAEVRRYIRALPPGRLVVLVSHGVTIAEILPEAAGLAAGEAAVVRAGTGGDRPLQVLGRLRWP